MPLEYLILITMGDCTAGHYIILPPNVNTSKTRRLNTQEQEQDKTLVISVSFGSFLIYLLKAQKWSYTYSRDLREDWMNSRLEDAEERISNLKE